MTNEVEIFPFRVTGWFIISAMIAQGISGCDARTEHGQLVGPLLIGQFVNSLGWVWAGYLMIPFCLLGFTSAWMVWVR
jgi:hypothetical protein